MTRPLAGPQTLLRAINARAILEVLARRGPLTRAELMGETGLSRTAVTQVLRMLETGESIASAGEDRATKGPAATRVSLDPRLGFALAVHVGHSAIRVALVDPSGVARIEQIGEVTELAERIPAIVHLIGACRAEHPGPIHLAVVGVPGIVTADGSVRDDVGPDGGAFYRALSTALGCSVRIENDINLAAIAECTSQSGQDATSFALLALVEDGLGAGFVLNGALHRGASGVAGEVQFLPQPHLPIAVPAFGQHVVSDLALTHGRDTTVGLSDHLADAAGGDVDAIAIVDELARRMTIVSGTLGLVLDPEKYILAGLAAHPVFLEHVRAYAEVYAAQLPMEFETSVFGAEATMVGAVTEATDALRETLFTKAAGRVHGALI